jgi:hypothetical protein
MSRFVFCFRIQGPHIGSSTSGSLCSHTTQVQVRWYGAHSEQRHLAGHLTVSASPRVQENNGTKSPDLHNFYGVITLLPRPTTPTCRSLLKYYTVVTLYVTYCVRSWPHTEMPFRIQHWAARLVTSVDFVKCNISSSVTDETLFE